MWQYVCAIKIGGTIFKTGEQISLIIEQIEWSKLLYHKIVWCGRWVEENYLPVRYGILYFRTDWLQNQQEIGSLDRYG